MPCIDDHQAAEWVAGSLSREAVAAVEAHLDLCDDCRRLLAQLASLSLPGEAAPPAAAPPTSLPSMGSAPAGSAPQALPADLLPAGTLIADRYLISRLIGLGGMGVVYQARDGSLDRWVAVKLVRSDLLTAELEASIKGRLLREAQLLAQLSHPNIVVVHDVGTSGGRIFMAMEYVEGQTLRRWLAAPGGRPISAIVAAFLDAARGLHAAHRSGVVHRDFKPDNVLVGDDGRVRVTDFGLARILAQRAEPEPAADAEGRPPAERMPTLHGGTPSYMSPEQRRGGEIDARTDQFAFCVALHEALTGQLPKDGLEEERIPQRLRAVLRRGLRPEPAERFPSMEALIAALTRPRLSPRARALLGGALLCLAAMGGLIASRLLPERPAPCRGLERSLAGIWDGGRRGAVERRFLSVGLPSGGAAFGELARLLDRYAAGVVQQQTEACEATMRLGRQSQEMMEQRLQCLREHLGDLRALSDLLLEADRPLLEKARDTAAGLSSLEDCSAERILRTGLRPPRDARVSREVEAIRGRLSQVMILLEAGRSAQALAQARQLVAPARATGYRPLEAEALTWLGRAQQYADTSAAAEKTLHEALYLAEASGHIAVARQCWYYLMVVVGIIQSRHEEGLRMGRHVQAYTERIGDRGFGAALSITLGELLIQQGRNEEALGPLTESLGQMERQGELRSLHAAHALMMLGTAQRNLKRFDAAMESFQRALVIREQRQGSEHPRVTGLLNSIGSVLGRAGRYEEARPYLERALAIRQRTSGPDSTDVGHVLQNLGALELELGRLREARIAYERALEIFERRHGRDHFTTCDSLTGLGQVHVAAGAFQTALPLLERSLKASEAIPDQPPLDLAEVRFTLAQALHGAGREPQRVRRLSEQAMAGYAGAGPVYQEEAKQVERWRQRALR